MCTAFGDAPQLILPFVERAVVNGKSYGLSACTYDCRIDQDLELGCIPLGMVADFMRDNYCLNWSDAARLAAEFAKVKFTALASTIERFNFPTNVCGSVLDKSSYARVFVSAFNTHLDPGWRGWLTVELVNLGDEPVVYRRGDPLCQVKFEWLDEPTDRPYSGKYQNQEPGPQPARAEAES
ncbi:MAG TPA: hypothetical protein VMS00_03795 [Acidimicrobiales bacterium]|nr:hypothetical protein [Acidimicrobiales bacterium]